MTEALFLLGFVTAQRAAELLWAERNTLRLRKAGAVEFGRSQYRILVAVHGFWLGGLWLLGPGQPVNIFSDGILDSAGWPDLGARDAGAALDHAGNRIAWSPADTPRTLSLGLASELYHRRGRADCGAAGAWTSAVRLVVLFA